MELLNSKNLLPVEYADAILSNNWEKAYEICASLAELGNASAEHSLGWFYQQGLEVPQSYEKAFSLWSLSAPKGIPESQAGLGSLYLEGKGTKVNYQKAYYWLSLAYRNGEAYTKEDALKAKKNLSVWQYLYIKLLLIIKT